MSLELSNATPAGLTASIHPTAQSILLGGDNEIYEIPLQDFLMLAVYVLINTDLHDNDPRLAFVEAVKQSTIVPGYNTRTPKSELSDALGVPTGSDSKRLSVPYRPTR